LENWVLEILFVGRDTTACTLSFGVARLMMHPEVAQKLRAEVPFFP